MTLNFPLQATAGTAQQVFIICLPARTFIISSNEPWISLCTIATVSNKDVTPALAEIILNSSKFNH